MVPLAMRGEDVATRKGPGLGTWDLGLGSNVYSPLAMRARAGHMEGTWIWELVSYVWPYGSLAMRGRGGHVEGTWTWDLRAMCPLAMGRRGRGESTRMGPGLGTRCRLLGKIPSRAQR
jgi:hypothetical protein